MADICSVLIHHVEPKDLDIAQTDDGHVHLRIGDETAVFVQDDTLDGIESLGKRLLELCRLARGKEILAAEAVLAEEPQAEPDVPITADLVSEMVERR